MKNVNINTKLLSCNQLSGSHHKNERRNNPKEEILNEKFHNTKSVRKPRTRWNDVFQRDVLEILGIRGWRRRDGYKEEGRRSLREARAQKGL